MKERKDLWQPEEDQYLKETVLEYTSNGDTKASAFKKASSELGRTVSACQYRWNAVLKESNSSQESNKAVAGSLDERSRPITNKASGEVPLLNLAQVICFLKNYAKTQSDIGLLHENKFLLDEHMQLKLMNEQLKKKLENKTRTFEKELEQYEVIAGILKEADCLLKHEGFEEKRAVH